jgi:hypothetical protein
MKFIKAFTLLIISVSCSSQQDLVDLQEPAQQIGDVMASVDESGGDSNGTMVFLEGQQKFIAQRDRQISKPSVRDIFSILNPLNSAEAGLCRDTSFTSCSISQRVRNLNNCTVGSATFSGFVTLSFSDGGCLMNSDGDTVDRDPAFTVTGRRGATLTVSKTGALGQRITRNSAGNFSFASDGIRRVFTVGSSTLLFDYTTETTSDITVTGTSRADRTMSGGSLRVTNNISSTVCNYVPSNVTWSASCNCASSGTWVGSCSDGNTTSVQITGCGQAVVTLGQNVENFSFDRCYSTL